MKRNFTRAEAKEIAECASNLADKVHYWKDRALRAEAAERMFATEVYANHRNNGGDQ